MSLDMLDGKTARADSETGTLRKYVYMLVPVCVVIVAALINWVAVQHLDQARLAKKLEMRTLSHHTLMSITAAEAVGDQQRRLRLDFLNSLVLRTDVNCAVLHTSTGRDIIAGDRMTCAAVAADGTQSARAAYDGASLTLYFNTAEIDATHAIFLRIALVALLCGLSLAIVFNGLSHNLYVRHEIDRRKRAESDAQAARRRAEQAASHARAASDAKGAFLATMSHEIRTPLNGIIGMSGMLMHHLHDETRRGYAQMIFNSGKSLLTLLNDTLDLSKIEAGRFELQPEDVCLGETICEAISLFQGRAQEKKLHLDLTLDDSLPAYVKADPVRVRQVLTNVISNAVKFTDAGCVAVEAYATPWTGACGQHEIIIKVSDTGSGIPASHYETIFERYGQTGQPQRQREGSGLGLSISRELARMMGGDITIDSRPGEGSTFTISLMLNTSPKQAPDDAATASCKPADLPGQSVTLVSANTDLEMEARNRLEPRGYELDTYDDAANLEISGKPSILVIDLDSCDISPATISQLAAGGTHVVCISRSPSTVPYEITHVASALLTTPAPWDPLLEHLAMVSTEMALAPA